MSLSADLFWSFRSPYSYLAIGRYRALMASHDVTINLRPVYPLAVRQPDFFERNHPNWLSYTMRDMIRVAQFHGIPFGPPRPDARISQSVVRVVIARNGRLLDVSVVRSSGIPEFDQGVLAGVRQGSPYSPLPPEIETVRLDAPDGTTIE